MARNFARYLAKYLADYLARYLAKHLAKYLARCFTRYLSSEIICKNSIMNKSSRWQKINIANTMTCEMNLAVKKFIFPQNS